jgi:predicted secreted protein
MNMCLKISKYAIIVFVLFSLVGCSKIMGNKCTTVDAQKYSGEIISVKNESCVTIEIDSQLSTGYRWNFTVKENPGMLIHSDYKVQTAEEKMVGGIDKEIFTFKAVKAGNATIVFNYVRPFDKIKKPIKTIEFNITITE